MPLQLTPKQRQAFIGFFIMILSALFSNARPLPDDGAIISYQLSARHYINSEKRYTTRFKLFIEADRSFFMEDNLVKYFDLHYSALSPQEKMAIIGTFDSPHYKFIVEKREGTLLFLEQLSVGRNIAYLAPKPEQWTVEADTATLAGWMTHQATCELGGRKWIAWFAPELPFSDGPYKFSGLPGLIVRLESEDGDYVFSLTGMEKMKLQTPKIPPYETVSEAKYHELKEYIMRNFTASLTDKGVEVKNLKWYGREVTLAEYNQLIWKDLQRMNYIEKLKFQ